MASEIKSLKAGSLYALALIGFSAAFALFLLAELYGNRGGLLSAGLNLAAAVALVVVCALAWPNLRTPKTAHLSWKLKGLILLACALALLARAPGL